VLIVLKVFLDHESKTSISDNLVLKLSLFLKKRILETPQYLQYSQSCKQVHAAKRVALDRQ
jgi:hypothetical protein